MRLKIIMLHRGEANAIGKNPDYYFLQGLYFIDGGNYDQAIKNFAKGVKDKKTHLLCRFNLGYTLFKVGHF